MWTIVPLCSPEQVIHILAGHEYVVGRTDCDVFVPNDMSISRRHAIIKIANTESDAADGRKIPTLQIKDISKLGTLLRSQRITNADCEKHINSGDVLEFGTAGVSKYRCIYEGFVVTTSCLDQSSKRVVKQHIWKLGGHVVGDWTADCSYVVMTNLSVTVKVICALVSLRHVVTPQFLKDLTAAFEAKTKLPDPNDYLPPLAESQVNPNEMSFKPDALRKSLFCGKRFYFMTASQLSKLQCVIQSAGGDAVLCSNSIANSDRELIAESSCVMWSNVSADSNSSIQHIQQLLARNKKRMILESEIGFAILYCSTTRYCNPSAAAETNSSQMLPDLSECAVSQVMAERRPPASSQLQTSNNTSISVASRRRDDEDRCPTAAANIAQQRSVTSAAKGTHEVDKTCDDVGSVTVWERHVNLSTSDDGRVVHSASLKVRSSFVPDSLAMDIFQDEVNDGNDVVNQPTDHHISSPVQHNNRGVNTVTEEIIPVEAGPATSSSSSVKRHSSVRANSVTEEVVSDRPASVTLPAVDHDDIMHTNSGIKQEVVSGDMAPLTLPSKQRVSNTPSNSVPAEVLPDGGMMVEERSLIRPPQARTAAVTWQGKHVKNFKRFKKDSLFAVLPLNMIGGRDLVPHESVNLHLNEILTNGITNENETCGKDKLSMELLSWEPPRRRKR